MADGVDERRQEALRVLALCDTASLSALWQAWEPKPDHTVLKGPETGLVMARGRVGGGGAPFNLGETTCTRCVVALASGEVGYGHILGRDGDKARTVALFDALGQCTAHKERVEAEVIAPLRTALAAAAKARASEVAATRVDFYTMARGED
ncbi:MAG: phosphonate C-P lyase system protein PhnG [Pseudomonadota bacterium]